MTLLHREFFFSSPYHITTNTERHLFIKLVKNEQAACRLLVLVRLKGHDSVVSQHESLKVMSPQ